MTTSQASCRDGSRQAFAQLFRANDERRNHLPPCSTQCWACVDYNGIFRFDNHWICVECGVTLLSNFLVPYSMKALNDHDTNAAILVGTVHALEEKSKAVQACVAPHTDCWACWQCRSINRDGSTVCDQCGGKKLQSSLCPLCDEDFNSVRECRVSGVVHETWRCLECETVNLCSCIQCRACKRAQNSWFCGVCGLENGREYIDCIVCSSSIKLSSYRQFEDQECLSKLGFDRDVVQQQVCDTEEAHRAKIILDSRIRKALMQAIPTAEDGNCQFRAIAYQLVRNAEFHHVVRRIVVTHIVANRNYYLPMIGADEFDEYVASMRRDSCWGDEITLVATSNVFKVTIHVIKSDKRRWYLKYSPYGNTKTTWKRQLFLAYQNPNHYFCMTSITDPGALLLGWTEVAAFRSKIASASHGASFVRSTSATRRQNAALPAQEAHSIVDDNSSPSFQAPLNGTAAPVTGCRPQGREECRRNPRSIDGSTKNLAVQQHKPRNIHHGSDKRGTSLAEKYSADQGTSPAAKINGGTLDSNGLRQRHDSMVNSPMATGASDPLSVTNRRSSMSLVDVPALLSPSQHPHGKHVRVISQAGEIPSVDRENDSRPLEDDRAASLPRARSPTSPSGSRRVGRANSLQAASMTPSIRMERRASVTMSPMGAGARILSNPYAGNTATLPVHRMPSRSVSPKSYQRRAFTGMVGATVPVRASADGARSSAGNGTPTPARSISPSKQHVRVAPTEHLCTTVATPITAIASRPPKLNPMSLSPTPRTRQIIPRSQKQNPSHRLHNAALSRPSNGSGQKAAPSPRSMEETSTPASFSSVSKPSPRRDRGRANVNPELAAPLAVVKPQSIYTQNPVIVQLETKNGTSCAYRKGTLSEVTSAAGSLFFLYSITPKDIIQSGPHCRNWGHLYDVVKQEEEMLRQGRAAAHLPMFFLQEVVSGLFLSADMHGRAIRVGSGKLTTRITMIDPAKEQSFSSCAIQAHPRSSTFNTLALRFASPKAVCSYFWVKNAKGELATMDRPSADVFFTIRQCGEVNLATSRCSLCHIDGPRTLSAPIPQAACHHLVRVSEAMDAICR